jgi:hypothetical protein
MLAVGRRVRALDRDNVGTVESVNDIDGVALVTFLSNDGRTASRALAWADLKMIDTPEPVELTSAATAFLAHRLVDLETAEAQWSSALVARGLSPSAGEELSEAIRMRIERVTADLAAGSPMWLTTWFGPRPPDAIGATVWDDAVSSVAVWRDRHGIRTDMPGLGTAPSDPERQGDWRSASSAALGAHTWLANRTIVAAISIPPLPSTQITERLVELGLLLATAPPDCRGLINRLSNGAVDQADLYDVLVEARSGQSARHSWILTNWPYIVESEELRRLRATCLPVSEAVRRCLDWLSAPDSSDAFGRVGLLAEAAKAGERWLLTALDELDQAGLLDLWTEGRIVTHLHTARDHSTGIDRDHAAMPDLNLTSDL